MGLTWRPGGHGSEDFYDAVAVWRWNVSPAEIFTGDLEQALGLWSGCNRKGQSSIKNTNVSSRSSSEPSSSESFEKERSKAYLFHNLG